MKTPSLSELKTLVFSPIIPQMVENLGIWQESRAHFLTATSDHCQNGKAREADEKCAAKLTAPKTKFSTICGIDIKTAPIGEKLNGNFRQLHCFLVVIGEKLEAMKMQTTEN